jgi:thioredoxin
MSAAITIDDTNFTETLDRSDGLLLVDFWAPWCAPCRAMGPIVEQIALAYAGRVRVAKVNVDQAPASAEQLGVRSIPTLALFRDGSPVDQWVGVVPRARLEAYLDTHLASGVEDLAAVSSRGSAS